MFAAQASFFILISAIPMIMIIFPFIQYLIPSRETLTADILNAIVPEASGIREFIQDILDDIYTNSTGFIVSFSAVTALWSASKGIYALQEGLNHVGRIKSRANYFIRRGKAILYTIAFIAVILFAVVFIMFGQSLNDLIISWFPWLTWFSLLIWLLRSVIAFELFIHFFILVYATLPSGHTYFTNKIPGAVFSTVGWMIFSYIYSFYINHFAVNSYIYGSLTALVLLMLWLYFCMIIFFVGAEVDKIVLMRSKNKRFTVRISSAVLAEAYGEEYLAEHGYDHDDSDMYPEGYVNMVREARNETAEKDSE